MNASAEQVAGVVVLAGAFLSALGYVAKKVRAAVHVLDAIESLTRTAAHNTAETGDLVSRELEHNHGGSMKDDVSAIAHVVGNLWRQVEDIDNRLTEHLDRKAQP